MKDFSKLDLYDFKSKYESVMLDKTKRLEYCPKKTSIHLTKENNVDITYMNTMPAMINDHTSFVKTIYVDLNSSNKTIEDLLYIKNGKAIRRSNIGLTPYRCGMVACLILDYLCGYEQSIGFIGTGKINKTIANMIDNWCLSVTNFSIQNKSKSQETFDYFNSLKPTNYDLSCCDVIFSCTNNIDGKLYSESDLSNAKCIVSFDGGCILDESTRTNREMFSDHIEQLIDVYENEFPNDRYKPIKIHQLDKTLKDYKKSFVNIYGIAYADAILFEQLIEDKDFENE